jgi:hypothetical protein
MAETTRSGSDGMMAAMHWTALWTLFSALRCQLHGGRVTKRIKAAFQSTAQRQNLLRAAFAGQLVPQDPADEPAAELLARIRAGLAAAGSQPNARRARARPEAA